MSENETDQTPLARYLTVAEIAKASRTSKMTIYRLVHSGELPALRVGRSIRVAETAWARYVSCADLAPEAGA